MTKQALEALARKLPPDTLFAHSALARFLVGVTDTEAAIAYILKAGWWDRRSQFGIREYWLDGRPEWRATVATPLNIRSGTPLMPTPVPASTPAPKPKPTKRAAPPIAGGLF